jgi:ERCC4-type nuclease
LTILIDKRGYGESKIASVLQVLKVPIEIVKLESADYVINNRGIERKTVKDLVNSCTKGSRHLWQQLETLKNTYERPLVLIEGKIPKLGIEKTLIDSISIGWGIPIILTKNLHETAYKLRDIHDKYNKDNKDNKNNIPPAVVNKSYTPERIRWAMLQCVKGIGSIKASKIIEELPDIFQCAYSRAYLEEKLKEVLPKESKELLIKTIT